MFNKISKDSPFNNAYFLLALILIFGLSLRLVFFSGMGISDHLVYSKTANDLNEGRGIDPESTLTLSTRIGLVYATAFSYRLFGISDFSATIFVLLTSLGTIVLAFFFGRLLFNDKIGLISAFLLSFFPLNVVYSTQLLSDIPAAFFMALGVYIFLYAELKSRLRYGLSYLLSGIFIGIGYLIRESVLLIALFFVFYIIYKKQIKKEYFLVPLGIVIVFLAEAMIFYNITGDPLYRTHASQQYLVEAVEQQNFFGRLDFPIGLLHYPWLFATNSLLNLFYFFAAIGLVHAIFYRKRQANLIVLWLVPLSLYLSFGTASLTQYIPFRAVDRYTAIFTIPAILLIAVFLAENRRVVKKYIMPLSLALLLISSVAAVYLHGNRNLLGNLEEAYGYLEGTEKQVYTDSRSLQALEYISDYNLDIELREYPKHSDDFRDSYVLINRNMIRNLKEAYPDIKFPQEIQESPGEWKKVQEFGRIEEDKVIIYFVG